jgi:hypothetical protein
VRRYCDSAASNSRALSSGQSLPDDPYAAKLRARRPDRGSGVIDFGKNHPSYASLDLNGLLKTLYRFLNRVVAGFRDQSGVGWIAALPIQAKWPRLFNHLVGRGQQFVWDNNSERLRGLQVDD